MHFYIGIKKILLFVTVMVLFFSGTIKSPASDYKYKILDPKYNPAAEKLINGETYQVESTTTSSKNGFNFLRFLAIFASIAFPLFVLYLATKAFKDVMESIPGSNESLPNDITLGNVRIEEKSNKSEISKLYNRPLTDIYVAKPQINKVKEPIVENMNIPEEITNFVQETYIQKTGNSEILDKNNVSISSSSVATIPIETKNPMLLNTAPLTKNKGLCLVEYENKYSLIGYINKKVFFLNQFDSLKSSEIRPRLTERNEGKDRYIVRLDSYKGLIEVSEDDMNLLINL